MPLVPSSPDAARVAVGFDLGILLRVSLMAFRHRWRMALAIVATVLAALMQITIPQLIGHAVDQAHALLSAPGAGDPVQRDATLHALTLSGAWLFAATVARGLFTMTQNYQGESVGHLLAHELRLDYYRQLQRLSFSYHDKVHTGELMTRGILDLEGVRMWVHTGILRMVLLSIMIVGGALVLMRTDMVLALVALAFVPVVGVGASWGRLKLRALWLRLQGELGVLTRIMEDNLGGIRVVRAFASQRFEMQRFDHVSARALGISHKRIAVFVGSTTAMTFVFYLCMGLVLWVGGERVISGRISLGELTAALAFMAILQQPVRQIAWMVNSIARASTCGARLFEILDLEPEIRDRPNARPAPERPATLRFENVAFVYPGGDPRTPVLNDISFELAPGEVLGIVGPPGSGKSTLAHLVARYYDVSQGRISLDGVDIRDYQLESLRRYVAVVQQDAFLFTSAIEANVAYGDPWADRSAIRQSTETAQLYNYVSQLPEGFDTLVGERGVTLSGGQRQRLAIARGLLPQARIVVFDDATAAIDAGTERDIRTALADSRASRGTIVIAHRLSSLMHADRILFIDEGRIVESGSHRELIELGGRYADLYELQTREAGQLAADGDAS
ncbi:MAG: ABC transporter ATP-binding protein [Gammaproteobacteria bacterium]|nr:ABC transporter ATP-binding protein [Gammaproteobacteria bacterium]